MSEVMLPEYVFYKNNSCATCRNCLQINWKVPDKWECHAEQNKSDVLDIVTGDRILKTQRCYEVRHDLPICPWHKPEWVFFPNGTRKHFSVLQKEKELASSSKHLRSTTVEDLI